MASDWAISASARSVKMLLNVVRGEVIYFTGDVGNQVQAQQRGEDAERVGQQRRIAHGAEGRGVHGHAGHRQVVVAHGLHAHDGEQAAEF